MDQSWATMKLRPFAERLGLLLSQLDHCSGVTSVLIFLGGQGNSKEHIDMLIRPFEMLKRDTDAARVTVLSRVPYYARRWEDDLAFHEMTSL